MLDAPCAFLMDFTAPFYRRGGRGSGRAVTQLLRGSPRLAVERSVVSLGSCSTLPGAAVNSSRVGS